ncbi:MAG: BrnT family toxin [Methylococcales bacterium]
MKYKWDSLKAAGNIRKHGVEFADAVIALEDEYALTIEDNDHHEQRFKTLGMGALLNILLVVHIERGEKISVLYLLEKQIKKRLNNITKG